MTTSHRTGLPRGRHAKAPIFASITRERAKGGLALAMTAGSAAVSREARRFSTISSPIATRSCLGSRTDRCPGTNTAARAMMPADGIWDPHQLEQRELACPPISAGPQTVNPHHAAFPKMMRGLGYRAPCESKTMRRLPKRIAGRWHGTAIEIQAYGHLDGPVLVSTVEQA